MQGMGATGEACPFEFNLDAATFKVGDTVSYRVSGSLADFPFVGTLTEVHEEYVMISPGDPRSPDDTYRGTREQYPALYQPRPLTSGAMLPGIQYPSKPRCCKQRVKTAYRLLAMNKAANHLHRQWHRWAVAG